MGGIVGGITDAIGLTDHAGEKKAAAAAAKASAQGLAMSKEQIALAKEQLDFQKAQYKDFTDVYGDLQTNLGNYYKNLTPDKLTALGLENQQREYQQVDTAIKRDFAQRGLTDSGQETAALTDNSFRNATARAQIRTNANQTVNDEKLKFLGIGLGQGTQELGIIANSAANVTNSYSNAVNNRTATASSYIGQATQLGVQNMQSMSDVFGAGATYLAAK